MKKRNLIILSLLIIGVFCSYILYQNLNTTHGTWSINWGFKVPKPTNLTTVFEGGGADWEAYVIAKYDEETFEKVRELKLWEPMNDDKNFNMVSERVAQFKKQILEFRPEYVQSFSDYPIEYDKNSLWFLKERERGDYFMAILNTNNKKLYTMELTF